MKNIAVIKHLLLPVMVMIAFTASGQARLVVNGAQMVIANNATLVIANDDANAITRFDGSIISEGENNKVQWMIGQTIGTYTIPWSDGTTYMPLTFTKNAGTGAGNFLFSTFSTAPQNSLTLPTGVTNLNRSGTDHSLYFIDRFWQLNAQGYTVKPSFSNVQFGYIDAEHAAPNTIAEPTVDALRWNDDTNTWDDFAPTGVADINSNTVTVASIADTDLYKWWSLMGESVALPVRFISFMAERQENNVRLQWKTADEADVQNYEVQRSVNGNNFFSIGITAATGGSGPHVYVHTDAWPIQGRNFYRIKQTDKNGVVRYSVTRSIVMDNKLQLLVYPNPVTENRFTINAISLPAGSYTIQLYGMEGKLVTSFSKELNGNLVVVELDKHLTKGMYLLKLTKGVTTFSTTLVAK